MTSGDKTPTVVAKNMEKFTSMKIDGIIMKDSLKFLNCSLDKLVTNLREKGVKEGLTLKEILPTTYSYFEEELYSDDGVGDDAFELLCRKGVYPYKYITDQLLRIDELLYSLD